MVHPLIFVAKVEGASGFGTPAALGAPMLVSSGYDPLQSVVVLLVFNTAATVFGAVGTPIWFGFGAFEEDILVETSKRAAIAVAIGSLVVIPWVLTILAPRQVVLQNLGFVYLSLLSSLGPALGIAFVSYEFPTLLGGIIGCVVTSILIKFKVLLKPLPDEEEDREWGTVSEHSLVRKYVSSRSSISDIEALEDHQKLDTDLKEREVQGNGNIVDEKESKIAGEVGPTEKKETDIVYEDSVEIPEQPKAFSEHIDDHLGPRKTWRQGYAIDILLRTFPIWGVVLILVLTRLQQIGLKEILQQREPNFSIHFGTLGIFRMSGSLVIQFQNILTYPNLNWRYEVLYVPFIIPFVVISALTLFLFRRDLSTHPREVVRTVSRRLANPAIALFGALALVQLMIRFDEESPAYIIGSNFSDWFKQGFVILSPLLGSLGSFFSGSTTVSNLTFGQVQAIAADSIGISESSLLALQVVGASAGNGICRKCVP